MTKPSKDLLEALDKIGIEYTEDGPITCEVVDEMLQEIGNALQSGHQAKKTLASMQPGHLPKELAAMGLDKKPNLYRSVDDYEADGFGIATATMSGKIQTPYGYSISLKKGVDYCVTQHAYKGLNNGMRALYPADKKFTDTYRPYKGQELHMQTLFVWREGGVGDLLFIRPILCHLKKLYPTCRIIFATKETLHPMVKHWGDCIDEYEPVPFECRRTLYEADYHITFMGVIERIMEAEQIDVHDLFAKHMGLDPDAIDWCCPMPTTSKNVFFEVTPANYVVVQARSSSPIRTPQTASLVAAINAITKTGMYAIIADMEQFARQVDDLISLCGKPELCLNFARFSKDIQDVVRLIDRASLVVAPDSSMVHIAAMQKVPSVAIYGPFSPETRVARYPQCSVIQPDRSDCCDSGGRGCFKHNAGSCDWRERCWAYLDNAKLAEMITEAINEQQ